MNPAPPSSLPRVDPGWLARLERIGNRLPDPPLLFALLCFAIILLSAACAASGWSVQPVRPQLVSVEVGNTPRLEVVPAGDPIQARSLATVDGAYWMISSMLRNFTGLPALGLIFVAMLGIGAAEKLGFFTAAMRGLALRTPGRLLTPAVIFIGTNSSVASDAGYIVLPPLAAALFHAVGRPPLAGLAAAFAGVAGGFGAGFFPTGGDGALAGFAQDAAHVLDPEYSVNILHNFYFKAGSAVVVTLAGWWVTDRWVEPRLQASSPTPPSPAMAGDALHLTPLERRGLRVAVGTMAAVLAIFATLILVPGMPLHGTGLPTLPDGRVVVHHAVTLQNAGPSVPAHDVLAREPFQITESAVRGRLVEGAGPRWSQAVVPIIFLTFLIPGIAYGLVTGSLKSQRDLVDALHSGVRAIAPVLVIAFFMGQFVNYFAYTRLDRMLAYSGGSALIQASLPPLVLLVLFILLVIAGDFAISGMLSKFGVLAPIFIPMFMMAGLSPELTTAAYRIGDSVVNVVTPLNSYLLVILAVMQKYRAAAGLGSLVALMLPYSMVFGVVWTLFLLGWYSLGLPLGPLAELHYLPRQPTP